MPDPVTWTLQYPVATYDQLNTFRRQFESLRHDKHVRQVDAIEHADRHIMSVSVLFDRDHNQPESPELRFLDRRYPVNASPPLTVHPTFELPRIAGLSTRDVHNRMSEVYQALRLPTMMPNEAPAECRPVALPKWLAQGRTLHKKDRSIVATVMKVSVAGGVVSTHLATLFGAVIVVVLSDLTRDWEPYERLESPRTSWARILDDEETPG